MECSTYTHDDGCWVWSYKTCPYKHEPILKFDNLIPVFHYKQISEFNDVHADRIYYTKNGIDFYCLDLINKMWHAFSENKFVHTNIEYKISPETIKLKQAHFRVSLSEISKNEIQYRYDFHRICKYGSDGHGTEYIMEYLRHVIKIGKIFLIISGIDQLNQDTIKILQKKLVSSMNHYPYQINF